jgi:hypothetical protein
MARMDEFARDWSYRGPLKTISYPKGYKGVLEPDVQMAARKARALVPPKRRKAAE